MNTLNPLKSNRIWQFVFFKVDANLRSEASRNYFSYLWWIFEPVLQMAVYYFAFGILLRRGTPDFVVYLLVSIIPWLWFRRTIENSASSILQNKGLILQVNLPKIIFPLIIILQNAVKQFFVVLLLLGFLCSYGITPSIHWLSLPFLIFTELCLISVFSCLAAALVPFLPDLKFLIQFGLQMVMFCSGIFYSIEMIPVQYHNLFFLNPIAVLLQNYRLALLYGQWPDWGTLSGIILVCIVLFSLIYLLIKKLDPIYARVIS